MVFSSAVIGVSAEGNTEVLYPFPETRIEQAEQAFRMSDIALLLAL
jgi:hypothetical protein